ncbi:MAG: double zinc ribbon domain-containing protein, partial [Anaerolineae bacterium]
MECPHCGERIASERLRFCPECGSDLPRPDAARPCPHCGGAVKGPVSVCPECGEWLAGERRLPKPAAKPAPK